jgi:FecR protein
MYNCVTVLRNATSLLLVLLLEALPMTVASADFSTGTGIVGTITGFGTLYLRGIEVRQAGTVFSGDTIQTGDQSQASLVFANGSRVQLASKTTFVTNRNNQIVQVSLIAGEIAFRASKSPVTIVCGEYQIAPEPNSSGGVAIVSAEFAAVRVATGKVTLRNIKDKSIVELHSGSEQILNLRTGQQQGPPVQLASTMPTRIPAPGQQGKVGSNRVNWALWGVIIAGGAEALILAYVVPECTKVPTLSQPC